MSIVGDAFAKPILRALDAEPDRWDISSLRVIVSSGVMWSARRRRHGLLRHNQRLIMVDSLGSSRGDRHGVEHRRPPASRRQTAAVRASARTPASSPTTAATSCWGSGEHGPGRDARLHAGRLLQGPGEVGGHVPGHRRRPLLDPRRLRHRRRRRHRRACSAGAAECINTGGEKVYPEEVEEVAQAAPDGRRRRRRRRARRALRRGDHRPRRAARRRARRRGRR